MMQLSIVYFFTVIPILTSSVPKHLELKSGESVNMSCIAEGHPIPNVYWTKNDIPFGNNTTIITFETSSSSVTISTLSINFITYINSGNYVCHAVNTLVQTVERKLFITKLTVVNCKLYVCVQSVKMIINCFFLIKLKQLPTY